MQIEQTFALPLSQLIDCLFAVTVTPVGGGQKKEFQHRTVSGWQDWAVANPLRVMRRNEMIIYRQKPTSIVGFCILKKKLKLGGGWVCLMFLNPFYFLYNLV